MEAKELKTKLDLKEAVVLLDIREEDELTDSLGHISGIIHIPLGDLDVRKNELLQHQEKEIVVICRSGFRAIRAESILKKAGFKNVDLLEGGMTAYRKMGY